MRQVHDEVIPRRGAAHGEAVRPLVLPRVANFLSTPTPRRPAVDVAVVTDRTFLPWCATTMRSCVDATGDADVRFHVLVAPDVSAAERDGLMDAGDAHVSMFEIDEELLTDFPSKGAALGDRISWVRTMLPDVLPDLDRVLYLDADTLVRSSVLPLWDAIDGAPIAAVANVTDPAMYPHLESLGFADPKQYFNAGVLVIDLERWRQEATTKRLADVASSRALPWFDQDALNVVFAGRWAALSPRWNAMNSLWTLRGHASRIFAEPELEAARADPAILHFEGPPVVKPWHYLSRHAFRDEYRSALGRTAWADHPVEERTLANRAIARLPDDRQLDAYVFWHRAVAGVQRRATDLSARARAKVRNRRVRTAVSPDDNMLFRGTLELYFETGEDALEQIRIGLAAAGVQPRRILDVPSGFGRVLRYLRAAWHDAELVAMELRQGAPEFCAATFGARPVQSTNPLWTVEGVGDDFDLVWSGSLLSHFDAEDWQPTLRYFRDRLRVGGALIFTTHGERAIDLLAGDPAALETVRTACAGWTGDYGVRAPSALVNRARESGFAFEDYGWEESVKWGVSVATPDWVRATVEAVGGLELVLHVPHGWSENQDVWTFRRQ